MKLDKCVICDYNETEGSFYSNTSPGQNGTVRLWNNRLLCMACIIEETQAIQDFQEDEIVTDTPPDTKDEWFDHPPSTLPLRDE
jgi:hypothetical protein